MHRGASSNGESCISPARETFTKGDTCPILSPINSSQIDHKQQNAFSKGLEVLRSHISTRLPNVHLSLRHLGAGLHGQRWPPAYGYTKLTGHPQHKLNRLEMCVDMCMPIHASGRGGGSCALHNLSVRWIKTIRKTRQCA